MTVSSFDIDWEYGLSVTLECDVKAHQTGNGDRYCNAARSQLRAKYNFSRSDGLYAQEEYEYLRNFFTATNGSEFPFNFRDPLDFEASHLFYDTGFGVKTIGILIPNGNNWQLAKQYILDDTAFVVRPITRPNDDVTIYDDQGTPVSSGFFDGGIVDNAIGGINYTWGGTFFVPVRFENDDLPQAIEVYNQATEQNDYKLPDLNLIEVFEFSPPLTHNIIPVNPHYYALPWEYKNTITSQSQTAKFKSQSNFEYRKTIARRNTITLSHASIEEELKNYLIGLYRVMLGRFGAIRFSDTQAQIDSQFAFTDSLTISVISQTLSPANMEAIGIDVSQLTNEAFIKDNLYQVNEISLIEEQSPIKTTYCRLWKVTKRNGETIGFTEHDADIVYNGDRYQASHSIIGSSNPTNSELEEETTDISGVVNVLAIEEEDLLGGQYENAVMEVFEYNWSNNTLVRQLSRYNLGESELSYVGSEPFDYKIQALSLKAQLDRSRSVLTSESCQHKFLSQGQFACNRTIDSSVRITANVVSATQNTIVVDTTLDSGYERGTIKPLSGRNADRLSVITTVSGNTLNLLFPYGLTIENGTQVELTRSCDKSMEACTNFNNQENHGGHPELMGADRSIASPS